MKLLILFVLFAVAHVSLHVLAGTVCTVTFAVSTIGLVGFMLWLGSLFAVISLYDPLFNHRFIQVRVGLGGLFRLRFDGYYIAYYEPDVNKTGLNWSYYIFRCPSCRGHYLASMESMNWGCPLCSNRGKIQET